MADKRIRDLTVESSAPDDYRIAIDDSSYTEAHYITVGDIRAMYRGSSAPSQTDILWLDTDDGIVYRYDIATSSWVTLDGADGADGADGTVNPLSSDLDAGCYTIYGLTQSTGVTDAVTYKQLDEVGITLEIGKNLYNPNTRNIGYYMVNGNLAPLASYATSDYIKIEDGTQTIAFSTMRGVAYYDSCMSYITQVQESSQGSYTKVPNTVAGEPVSYIRFYATLSYMEDEDAQVEVNTTQTTGEPFSFTMNEKDGVEIEIGAVNELGTEIYGFIGAFGEVDPDAYWVDASMGNNSWDGSELTPWHTLNYAALNAPAGATIYVKEGTYVENDGSYHCFRPDSNSHRYYAIGEVIIKQYPTGSDRVMLTQAPIYMNGFTFDGQDSLYTNTYTILQGDDMELVNCKFINCGTAAFLNVSSSKVTVIDNCEFIGECERAIQVSGIGGTESVTIKNCTFTDVTPSGVDFIYVQGSGDLIISGNTFTANLAVNLSRFLYHVTACDITLEHNEITIPANGSEEWYCLYLYHTSNTGNKVITIDNNIMNIYAPSTTPVIRATDLTYDNKYYINNNEINILHSEQTSYIIHMLNQRVVEINGNTITTMSNFGSTHISVNSGGKTIDLEVVGNTCYSRTYTGHIILIGSDGDGVGSFLIDEAKVWDNKVYGLAYFEPEVPYFTTHSIFVGWQIDADIRYNTVIGCGIGIGVKGGGQSYTKNGIQYNMAINCFQPFVAKAVSDIQFSNNTVYSDGTIASSYAFRLAINNSTSPSSICTGVTFKNNIVKAVDMTSGFNCLTIESGNDTGLVSDYNCYYLPNNSGSFSSLGDFATYQVLGYETNGLWDLDPYIYYTKEYVAALYYLSPCINTGTDLGTGYELGASWSDRINGLELRQVDQDDFGAGWDMGAYVYEKV